MKGKYLYLEFLIPVKDYFATLKLREAIFDFLIPVMASEILYLYLLKDSPYNDSIKDFNGHILSFLSVFIGFSIAAVTLFITSNNKNIERLQEDYSDGRKIGGRKITLYQLVLIIFTYALVIEVLALIFNLTYFLTSSINSSIKSLWSLFYAIDIFLLMHILSLNLRNITNLYFVFLTKIKKTTN